MGSACGNCCYWMPHIGSFTVGTCTHPLADTSGCRCLTTYGCDDFAAGNHPHAPNTADTADLVADLRWLAAVETTVAADAADEIERLSAIVAAVDAWHQPRPGYFNSQCCRECDHLWPCDTHLAVHPEDNR